MTAESRTQIDAALYLIERALDTVENAKMNCPNKTDDDKDTKWTLNETLIDLAGAHSSLSCLRNGIKRR